MTSESIPYLLAAWNSECPDTTNTQATIQKLLRLKLTRFQYGYLLGLTGHGSPSARQLSILEKIVNQTNSYEELKGKQKNDLPKHNGANRANH